MKAESISPVQGLQTLVYYQQVFLWQFYLQRMLAMCGSQTFTFNSRVHAYVLHILT